MSTLKEMAVEYRRAAALIARCMWRLRKEIDSASTTDELWRLKNTMSGYDSALRDIRATAKLLDSYYDHSRLDLDTDSRKSPEINNIKIPRCCFGGREE